MSRNLVKNKKYRIQSKRKGERPLNEIVDGENTFKVTVSASKSTPYEINPVYAKQKAKELYIIHNYKPKNITEALGVPKDTLEKWIYKGSDVQIAWKEELRLLNTNTLERLKEDKADVFSDMMGLGADLLLQGLKDLQLQVIEGNKKLSVADLRKINDIMSDLNKNVNLEQGKPTEIRRNFDGTQEELDKLLEELSEVDEFGDYGDIEH